MIRNQWYAVLSSKEVPRKGLVGVRRLGEKLAFWRDEKGNVSCIIDKCCHRGASLSAGKIVDGQVQCPFHGFQYDSEGKVKLIPANGRSSEVAEQYRVQAYKATDLYGFIWVWWGNQTDNIPDVPFFEDLKKGFNYSQIKDHWFMHYTRCIENQLDAVHLPFVHYNTIGSDNRTIVHGPKVRWEGDMLNIYVKNVEEDGITKAMRAEDMGPESGLFALQIIMPNIWHNIIAEKVRVFAAFAPIDDENTMIYLRFYQAFMPLWGIRHIIGFFGNISSRIILRQDKRVVATQLPKMSSLNMDEKLIPGDRPIIEFRRRREELKKKSSL